MSRPHVVIVGAGLGGCVLANQLASSHLVTVVERDDDDPAAPRVVDVGRPAVTDPHHAVGLGGSTRLWHNGLIEISPEVFESRWPFGKEVLRPYYRQAWRLLSDGDAEAVGTASAVLGDRYRQAGLSSPTGPGLYYPRWPVNAWKAFRLAGRVDLIRGDVKAVQADAQRGVVGVRIRTPRGIEELKADAVVLAAGGLGTPILLQGLPESVGKAKPGLRHAGSHYEDHPMGFVGEVEITAPLFRLWNFRPRGLRGNLRLPIVIQRQGLQVSFQLRPSSGVQKSSRRERVGTALNDLRRHWWSPAVWWRVLRNRDDVLDILSFKLGVHLPTPHYTVLMVAQMPTEASRSVWRDPASGDIHRCWTLSDQYLNLLDDCIGELRQILEPISRSFRVFACWRQELRSAAHHSGTARLSRSPDEGVCNEYGQVHGVSQLYVCDGSLIPASGISNTGLTIAALALRLADHMRGVAGQGQIRPVEA